ncbi:MAG: competence/damage-inducible protein A [Fimbriimonadaceae bacterium]|nr:competence/damage-inducible protein A [Fimbriimonadaceae bacterium]
MTAEIVSVGTELLMGQIADTNAQALGRMLPELGISHHFRQTVGDNLGRLTEALRLALGRSDIVFTIGGLGPTEDDLTRDGIAAALGVELVHDPEIEAGIRKIFEDRRLKWTESQRRQAMRPACAEALANPNGTAPGLFCRLGGKIVVAMPGPKGEFGPMLALVRDRLGTGDSVIHSRILRVAGMGESAVEDRIRAELASANPSVAPYAKPGEVHLRLTARAASTAEADAMLDPLEERIRGLLGDAVFGVDDQTLESVVLAMLREAGQTLAVAESCTGGGLGARLTSVPGASDVFLGGVITYANEAKARLLDVPLPVLEGAGAVSEECAEAMAAGARGSLGADWAVSITGIAGPDGGTEAKPVGTVWIAIAGPGRTKAHEFQFRGTREDIRGRSSQMALTLLRRALL